MSTDITQATEKTPTDSPETTGGGRIYRPLTDIVETDQGVSMMLEMPGVAPDAVAGPFREPGRAVGGERDRRRPARRIRQRIFSPDPICSQGAVCRPEPAMLSCGDRGGYEYP